MNLIATLKACIIEQTKVAFAVTDDALKNFEFKINAQSQDVFGDLSCNVAMIIAKSVGSNPRAVATAVQKCLEALKIPAIQAMTIAGPGFLNITLAPAAWTELVNELYTKKRNFFKDETIKPLKYLIEFVSANPTGPLHIGGGRGGIIGDTLARVLTFLGHTVSKEFYINDAGNQVKLLGQSFKARCLQELGIAAEIPEGGYVGQYLVDMAKDCLVTHGPAIEKKDDEFFKLYAIEHLLNCIKADLTKYNVTFDTWFSENTIHTTGIIETTLNLLKQKNLAYEADGALWFRATNYGDDKDRVLRKSTGEPTYITPDLAYHKNKFDRGYDVLIDILGHDHHGYVNRLKATMQALGYRAEQLQVILYQLVSIKNAGVAVKMSKRSGNFTQLGDVIEAVGTDVARYFYLKSKADSSLDFDMELAVKQTDENPVYYIQYAYVRMNSVMIKAKSDGFGDWVQKIDTNGITMQDIEKMVPLFGSDDRMLVKKIIALSDTLRSITLSYHTHLIALYTHELAQTFHAYYTRNKILDSANIDTSHLRLCMVNLTYQTLDLCLDLLGLTKPERM